MVYEQCRRFRSRALIVVLCASVFLLALHTRLCLFQTYKQPIKTFADDYDRLKVKVGVNRHGCSAVSVRAAAQSIVSFPLRPIWGLDLHTAVAVEGVARRLTFFVGLRGFVRPPPLQ